MARLYILTGPAGVGKSTISKGIAERLEKSVLLEGDDFYHQVIGSYVPAWEPGNHLDVFWKVCIDTINNYLNAGYDVVFNYIISKDKFIELKNAFENVELKFVVLLVDETTILKRDRKRPKEYQMKERCLVLLNEFLNNNYDDNYILYTDKLSINQTTDEIISNEKYYTKQDNL